MRRKVSLEVRGFGPKERLDRFDHARRIDEVLNRVIVIPEEDLKVRLRVIRCDVESQGFEAGPRHARTLGEGFGVARDRDNPVPRLGEMESCGLSYPCLLYTSPSPRDS